MSRLLRSLLFILLAFTVSSTAFSQATIKTDLLDYPPGSTAIITGTGWQPGETVTLQVLHQGDDGYGTDEQYHQPFTTIADANGNVSSSWWVPDDGDALGATFVLSAVGGSSGLNAEWTFTDNVRAPANLDATLETSDILLKWSTTGGNDNDGYQIEKKIGSGSYSPLVTLTVGTQYTDNSITACSNTYQYRIRAYKISGGNTTFTDWVESNSVSSVDNTKPTITDVPDNITINSNDADATSCAQIATWTEPKATDNCGVTSFTSDHASGASFPVGPTTVTYTAEDAAGNTQTASFTVTVVDNTKPTITDVPDNITINSNDADATSCAQIATWTEPKASDNCGVTSFTSDHASGASFPVGPTTVTYTAEDAAGNTQTASFTVTVVDNTKPTITDIPDNITINSNDADATSCAQIATWTEPKASDNCGVTSFTSDHASGASFPVGPTTVTYTAEDAAGNTQTASFTVTVVDNTKPTITDIPDNITINSNDADATSCAQIATWTEPKASDNCGVTSFTSDHASGASFPVGPTTVTYTAEDAAGNTQTASFTVTVVDNTKPTITDIPDNIIINSNDADATSCAQIATWTEPKASDNCGVTSFTSDHASGASFPVGPTTVTYTAEDAAGNTQTASFTVTVVDNTKPTITDIPDNITINSNDADATSCAQIATWTEPKASDNCGVTSFTSDHASGASFPVGPTTVTYTAEDAAGNTQTASFTVTVVDNTKPTITDVPDNITINSNDADATSCAQIATWTEPKASDNCGVTSFTSDHASGASFPVGPTTVTYTAEDAAGNTQTASFTVTVVDNTKPTITDVPDNITINSNDADATSCAQIATWTEPKASDNCGVTSFTSDHASGASFPVGPTTVTYTAEDAAGNTQTASFTVTVVDNTKPVITCPADIILSACTPTATWSTPLASDNCSVASVTQTGGPASGSTFANGSTTLITYLATDASGNHSTCSFNVIRATAITTTASSSNPHLYFGAPGIQTATISTSVSGGTAPYTVTVTMNRPLTFNYMNDDGDEVWTGLGGTSMYTTSSTVAPTTTMEGVTAGTINLVTVSLLDDADFTVTVTDANDCTQTATVHEIAEDARCFAGKSPVVKVSMCHLTNSAKNPRVQICVDENAVQTHLDDGDYLGSCTIKTRDMSTTATEVSPAPVQQQEVLGKLTVNVMPNPTSYFFKVVMKSLSKENVKVTVMDITGRVIEQKTDVPANSTIQLGDKYHPGIYIAEFLQGNDKIVLRLIKEGK